MWNSLVEHILKKGVSVSEELDFNPHLSTCLLTLETLLPPACAPTGDQTPNLDMCLERESKPRAFSATTN